MKKFIERFRDFCGNLRSQDVAEYAVMVAVIVLLVIGAAKFNGSAHHANSTPATPTGASQRK